MVKLLTAGRIQHLAPASFLVCADSASNFMLKRVRSGAVNDEGSCRKYLCGGDEEAQQTEVNIAAV